MKDSLTNSRRFAAITLLATFFLAQDIALAKKAKPLFRSSEPLEAVLTAPIVRTYNDKKKKVREYHQGTFAYVDGENGMQRTSVKIRTRGNFRRAHCLHPPLTLNFKKTENKGSLFDSQDKLKLVAPCKRGAEFQEFIGLEYAAYKMFELVSDFHFKTRLINLNYVDSNKKRKPWKATAFVIEDEEHMAKRSKRELLRVKKNKRRDMHLAQTAMVELFQFMIGNLDYSTFRAVGDNDCCHNVKLLGGKNGEGKIIPVPYDFDSAGLVNAPYALPPDNYNVQSVRNRYFNGWCKDDEHFLNAVELFKHKKPDILSVVENSNLVGKLNRKKNIKYLNRFFNLIEDSARVKKLIIDRCRGSVIEG